MTDTKQIPVVGFSFNLSLTDRPNGDNAVVQYHLPIDYSLELMEEHTSKVLAVFERQKLKHKHSDILREKQVLETFIEKSKEDLQEKHSKLAFIEQGALQKHISSGRKGELKFTGATGSERDRVKQDIISARQSLDNLESKHKHLLIELEVTEKKLGINSSADSSESS